MSEAILNSPKAIYLELGVGIKDPDSLRVKSGDCRFCWGTGRVKEGIQTGDSVCSACRGTGKEAL